jgi:hypothetical protein
MHLSGASRGPRQPKEIVSLLTIAVQFMKWLRRSLGHGR